MLLSSVAVFIDVAFDGVISPVLKHGPGSPTCPQVLECQTLKRREIELSENACNGLASLAARDLL